MKKETRTVVYDDEITCYLRPLHEMVMSGISDLGKEENLLFEKGVLPIDAALQTGFSDQSHFTNYFSSFIGLAPGVYREIFLEKDKGGEQHGK